MAFAPSGAHFTNDILQILKDETSFEDAYKMYEFEPKTIFLRDVDAEPKMMKEDDLK